jgi:TusA-related sulfurtransferase
MHSFDLRHTIIPFSLLRISNIFKEMALEETIEVEWIDPDMHEDLLKVLPKGTYEVLIIEKIGNGEDGYRMQLKKSKQEPFTHTEEEEMSENLSTVQTASTVDARGSACPGPLLEAKKGIGKVKVGEVLEVYSNDSGTRRDIPAWANKVGHEYLGVLEADGYDKHFVRRKK